MILLAIWLVFFVLWLLSLRLRDASIVDIAWGPVFSVVPALALLRGGTSSTRQLVVLALLLAWGLRLGVHLFLRNCGHGEDYRYAQMRRAHGKRFAWLSLFTVFSLQALLVFIISMPVQLVFASDAPPTFSPSDLLACGVVLIGLCFESVSDWQLTRFRREPANRGRVLDTGLWRYSRHPNYFGDAVVWWGLGLLGAASSPSAWIGPVVMTVLLLRVSGVTLLEKTIVERRPEYAAYIANTSAFLPLPRAWRRAP